MHYTSEVTQIKGGLKLTSAAFSENKYAYYKYLREQEPVHKGTFLPGVKGYFVSRYQDISDMLKDPRLVRQRATATGGKRNFPIPLPKGVKLLMQGMINVDDPQHRRLRTLVHKAFTPKHVANLHGRVEEMTHQLLDEVEKKPVVELRMEVAKPIPTAVIAEMLGVELSRLPEFTQIIQSLTQGLNGFRIVGSLLVGIPKAIKIVRELIEDKRKNPADDMLTALILAEEEGDKLTEDELVAMVFLLIIGGYETTFNLITNAVFTLLYYPESLDQLRNNPDLMDSAIEEILRYNGPVHGTKMEYATEDLEFAGVKIPKGSPLFPFIASANHDPAVFERPEVFDIARTPNKHLGFSMGGHYCLGAPLARMETKVALKIMLDRYPDLRLAVPKEQIVINKRLGWHEYKEMPLHLR
ncbi:MAG: cytochrome P450 [Bacteroidota bacterium]